jgi:CPA2 family monovalent cation:H+ antiporter-2
VTLVTMFATPLMSRLVAPIYGRLRRLRATEPLRTINVERDDLRDHVVICGAGRVGHRVAIALRERGHHGIAIEVDQHRFEACSKDGLPLIYGDAAHPTVLEAAGLDHACLLVITTPAAISTLTIARHARQQRPELHIVARAESETLVRELEDLGVFEVVQSQVEVSIELLRQSLEHLGSGDDEIAQITREIRHGSDVPTA